MEWATNKTVHPLTFIVFPHLYFFGFCLGYGTFAPKTIWGQIFVVFFAIIGIPFSGLTLVHLADAALTCVTRLFTMGSDKVQKAFNVFDTDGSGELDLEEFREAIKSLGIIVTDSQFQELVNEIDQDGSGELIAMN